MLTNDYQPMAAAKHTGGHAGLFSVCRIGNSGREATNQI